MDLDYCIICGKATSGNLYCSRECHLQDCPSSCTDTECCVYSQSAEFQMLASQHLDHFRRRSSVNSSSILNGFISSRLTAL
ncbi:extender-the chronological lifespan protein Ecl2 [Schizosaccharomyces japonicus yFS275]|uniref:Extender-the chronological lifespan protein Ecl2 n=1 Tax=Schizosaccharomyces japonicus (strain yFS275 / FY16936) TaxID=402676 RepID=B6K5K0_SCHJY|nr:extender-the chronological lifespan protein Ecl2 [Schizosaccharomyces japonicus yFS275]EEB08804.1 extender-the chronological lifespan protein Ecl2 [Schizosaccharomyces japonicus yFS275]